MAAKIIAIIDVQQMFGQEILNVFHYVDPGGTGDEATLVDDYINHVIPVVKTWQHINLDHVAIRHFEVYPTRGLQRETAVDPVQSGSVSTTDPLASADAWSVKWLLGATTVLAGGFTGHIKRGGTRIAGPYEGGVNGNTVVSTVITSADSWKPEILLPNGGAFALCVASFLDGSSPRGRHDTVQAYATVEEASDPGISTQNTRKILRGRVF